MLYLTLFYEFFKIGLFAIGGGLATIPFLQNLIDKYDWMAVSQEELVNMIAISESTPGPIGINMATYVGYETGGIAGGILATLGLILPSIIIIILISRFFMQFADQALVKAGFTGLRPAVVGLIAAAGFEVVRVTLIDLDALKAKSAFGEIFNLKALILAALLLLLTNVYKTHPIFFILAAAVVGVVFKF